MAGQYFVADDRKRGALTWGKVWDLARAGEIRANTLILLPGASCWLPACEIEHVRDFFPTGPRPEASSQEQVGSVFFAGAEANSKLAGPYSRFLARLIDYVILVSASMTLMVEVPGVQDIFSADVFGSSAAYVRVFYVYAGPVALMWLIVQLLLALCMGVAGTSPGKAILGLNVRSLKNESPLRLHLRRELKIWVLVICLGFHTTALFQVGRQYVLLRFGQPTIYDGKSSVVEGRPSASRFALAVAALLLLSVAVLCMMAIINGQLPLWP
ncbi:RDD family protein [Rhizobium sp. XQZ8]|uniref:RDD family protein n=1 Tax=Rhizobium populisoli TaxID=2859785 RepID=UPI001C6732FA|nr:RDD family protein [Rhizobium populisoli]MBW6423350.1 RDD family protein [Rhizobium populisoli]